MLSTVNGLLYCKHGRDTCNICNFYGFKQNRDVGFRDEERPFFIFPPIKTQKHDLLLAKRWREMQRLIYPIPKDRDEEHIFTYPAKNHEDFDVLKCVSLVRQIRSIASTERYQIANSIKILFTDYHTFLDGSLIYEELMEDWIIKIIQRLKPSKPVYYELKSRCNMMYTFYYYCDRIAWKNYWRSIEDSFHHLVEHFQSHTKDQPIITDQVQKKLNDLASCVFWTLQYIQFRFKKHLESQHFKFQVNKYPFYPFDDFAVEENSDAFVSMWRLATADLYDFNQFSTIIKEHSKTMRYQYQYKFMSPGVMEAFNELLTHFTLMDTILSLNILMGDKPMPCKHEFNENYSEFYYIQDVICDFLNLDIAQRMSSRQKSLPLLLRIMQKRNEIVRGPTLKFLKSCELPNYCFFAKYTVELYQLMKSHFESHYLKYNRVFNILSIPYLSKYDIQRGNALVFLAPKDTTVDDIDLCVPTDIQVSIWQTNPIQKPKQAIIKKRLIKNLVEHSDGESGEEHEEIVSPTTETFFDRIKGADVNHWEILQGKRCGIFYWADLENLLSKMDIVIHPADFFKFRLFDPISGYALSIHRPYNNIYRNDQKRFLAKCLESFFNI